MYLLMDAFGGKSTPLENIFHFAERSLLGARKVELVAGRLGPKGMSVVETLWLMGSSDGIGFKAKSAQDAFTFLGDPKGKPFLFPDNHMGLDLLCFLRDAQTGELIVVLVQAKVKKQLDTKTWIKALESINPENFYTVAVRVETSSLCFQH